MHQGTHGRRSHRPPRAPAHAACFAARTVALAPVSWDAALDFVAERLIAIRGAHGAPALAAFGSGALTNEKAYVLGKFARVALRIAEHRLQRPLLHGLGRRRAEPRVRDRPRAPLPLSRTSSETDTLMLWGSNCAETMPPIMQWIYAQRDRGGALIVVDPRATETARAASLHLQLTPGTDLALANALLHIAIRDGLVDEAYIADRTEGFDDVRRAVLTSDPAEAERITGVSIEQQVRAVRMLADVERSMVLSGRGPEQQSKGTDTVLALINLMLALGKVGKPFSGYGCITGQGNGQGGREHGQKADQLPGYRLIENPEHRAEIARIWNVDPADLPRKGKSAYELLDSLGPARRHPRAARVRIERGGRVAERVERGAQAPRARPARRLRRVRERDDRGGARGPARRAVGGGRGDDDEPGGARDPAPARPAAPARRADGPRRHARARRAAGRRPLVRVSLAERRLRRAPRRRRRARGRTTAASPTSGSARERGVFWPCPHDGPPWDAAPLRGPLRAPRAAARAFSRWRIGRRPSCPTAQYPLYFTTGRYREHYNSGAQTRRVERRSWTRSRSRACR